MRWVLSLVAVILLLLGGTAFAGPDEGEKASGGGCGGCEVSQPEVSQTVADEQATTVQMTLLDAGEHGGKQVKLILSGPWQEVPEATRERLLSKLKEMLPEPALRMVLKQLVAGERTIDVAVPTAQPKATAIPAIRLRPANVGGAAGTASARRVMRVMSEEDLEKLPPEIRKRIEAMKAHGAAAQVKVEPAGNQVRVVTVKPQAEVEIEKIVVGERRMGPGQGQGRGRGGQQGMRGGRGGRVGSGEQQGMRGGRGGRGGSGGQQGMRGGRGGRGGSGGQQGMRGGRGGRGGSCGCDAEAGRGSRDGRPGADGGNPLLRAMEELTREIRGLRSDLRNAHRPPASHRAAGKAEGCGGDCGGDDCGEQRGNARPKSCDDCGDDCPGDCEDSDDRDDDDRCGGDGRCSDDDDYYDDDAEELEEDIEELEEELQAELREIREDLKRMMKEIESLRSK